MDGSTAFDKDSNYGVVFLFNPNGRATSPPNITLDADIGIDCARVVTNVGAARAATAATAATAQATAATQGTVAAADVVGLVTEVYPMVRHVTTVACGGVWSPPVLAGKSAVVYNLSFVPAAPWPATTATTPSTTAHNNGTNPPCHSDRPLLLGVPGTAVYNTTTQTLTVINVVGERGTTVDVRVLGLCNVTRVLLASSTARDRSETMHTTWAPTPTVSHPFVHDPTRRETTVRIAMGGGPTFSPSQVLNGTWTFSPTGGSFSANALHVPAWVMEQLARRNTTYPVPWNENDLSASWLSPGRLLLFLEASPSAVPSTGLPNVGANTALPPHDQGDGMAQWSDHHCAYVAEFQLPRSA